tara:strand:- start:1470 stop:3773 length:2304 start_codon:yes stop_codon:yes gene_type:complete
MLEQGLIKTHFLGKDGFIWWIGQVVDQTKWAGNLPATPTKTTEQQKGFDFRYKVRIMGYHTASPSDLTDDELPWASVMLPVTAGTSGGAIQTPQLRQGNFVYGFFMDGEDAQMPIIMGVIGYNQYTAVMKNVPDTPFSPFSGYTVDDTVPISSLGTTQEEGEAVAEDVDKSKTNNKEVMESPASLVGRKDGASKESADNEGRPKNIPTISRCEPSPLVSIQREMKNMLAETKRLNKTVTDWETKVSTKVDDLQKELAKVKDNATKAIAGDVKRIVNEQQKNAIKKVNDALSESYNDVFPTELPELKVKVEEANDELACLFRNINKNLTGMVGGFLDQAMDRFITTPPCATENFTGSLLGKVSGLIDSAISSVMNPIKSLLAGMGAATGALDDVMGFATDSLSFLICEEEPRCSEVKEWNPISGAEQSPTLDLFSIVNKAKEASSLVQNAVEGITNIGDTLSDIAQNADFSDAFKSDCNVGPVNCGPPTVEFIGGGGSGATGNVIVSAVTTVLGVDIITPGGNYIGPPRIKFTDSCNKGRGATGRAVMGQVPVVGSTTGETTLGVTGVIMDDTGIDYLPSPDGSQGGDGFTWANPDETTVRRADGTYDTPYKPGTTIPVSVGDEVTNPGGRVDVITEVGSITALPLTDETIGGTFPSLDTGEYPVVLEIDSINVVNPGFGYNSNDNIVVGNGAELKLNTDSLGSVTGVDVINGGIGFNEDPNIYIESDSGYNAKLMPVFKVNRLGDDVAPEAVDDAQVIQVIDCVGKF